MVGQHGLCAFRLPNHEWVASCKNGCCAMKGCGRCTKFERQLNFMLSTKNGQFNQALVDASKASRAT
jgi:hypothetical protein